MLALLEEREGMGREMAAEMAALLLLPLTPSVEASCAMLSPPARCMMDAEEVGETGLVALKAPGIVLLFTAVVIGSLKAGTVGICCVPGIRIGAEIVGIANL